MHNKEEYERFCQGNYVPIYSKPWWMDAVCGAGNWDVWLYGKGRDTLAAMPYYLEQRGKYRYITKAPLTQNNGIIFASCGDRKISSRHAFEEKVVDAAVEHIRLLGVDVYEQQYQSSFDNWLPFFWNRYTAVTRYSYVIDSDRLSEEEIWSNISSKYRNKIRKGRRAAILKEGMDCERFYREHEKIFRRQGLECPFSLMFWEGLYEACARNACGRILYMADSSGNVLSLIFLVWDERYVYQLLAGPVPEYASLDAFEPLVFEGIRMAAGMGRKYDFEGSVIKRISRSMREFGGTPVPYFRIRKVFSEEVMEEEHRMQLEGLRKEGQRGTEDLLP